MSLLCGCVEMLDEQGFTVEVTDTTECAVHPINCEALHPLTGQGCHHNPGHDGDHAYLAWWPADPTSPGEK